MGAWGAGIFENDAALDWVYELEGDDTLDTLEAAFNAVMSAEDYIDADEGSYALAAAEVVAALAGRPDTTLPEEVTQWVAAHAGLDARPLLEPARKAIQLVLESDDSELRELWEEAEPDDFAAWQAAVNELRSRLG